MNDFTPNKKRFFSTKFVEQMAALNELQGLLTAILLICIVATVDYMTGYDMRLAILYMLPIALATWTGGVNSGIVASIISTGCWLTSFQPNHLYSREIFYYWEGLILIVTFLIFVHLISGLRGALARADKRFVRVLESLHAGIYVIDNIEGKVLYANRRLAKMIDNNPLLMRASDFESHFSVVGKSTTDRQGVQSLDSEDIHFSSREAHNDKDKRWYLIQSGLIHWENNERVTLKVITDISEQKQAQILRHQHQEMLHDTARFAALAEIASTLAHEINQPLMAISSYHEACIMMLSNGQHDTATIIDAMKKSRAQAMRASQIIASTREFLQRRTTIQARCNINEAVNEAVEFLEVELQEAGVSVDLQLHDSLPDFIFDRTLIAQVIVNLLHNAIDAMRSIKLFPRSVIIRTNMESESEVLIAVIDRGTGIQADVADKLYTSFFSTKPQGLGLGLCICRSVVEAHAGHLWHSVNPGGGTAFQFTLPLN